MRPAMRMISISPCLYGDLAVPKHKIYLFFSIAASRSTETWSIGTSAIDLGQQAALSIIFN